MDGQRFDTVVSALGSTAGRRGVAKGLGALALTGLGLVSLAGGAAADKKDRCMDRCKEHCSTSVQNRKCNDRCRRRCEDR